jgi:cytochrome c
MVRIVIGALVFAIAASSASLAAGGDPVKGQSVFQQCQLCHNAAKNGGNGLGPNLFGVAGRKAASLPDFAYSDGLKKSKFVWTDAMLKKWVAGPQKIIPGTRMTFAGLTSKQDIDDVIAFLKTKK